VRAKVIDDLKVKWIWNGYFLFWQYSRSCPDFDTFSRPKN
jgi:hypothetical protein